ncbi:hypothetical protein SF123566_3762 [Shigella flexneri 1235-66]|nr:hypothetical protein SF123566_3762 [Shigella flexneri 1235-66]
MIYVSSSANTKTPTSGINQIPDAKIALVLQNTVGAAVSSITTY